MTQATRETIDRLGKLLTYLNTYVAADVQPTITKESVENTTLVLRRLVKKFPELPIPIAEPGLDGEVGLTWEKENHHAEADIDSEGQVEFSYYNRDTDYCWSFKVPVTELDNSNKVVDVFRWIA